MISRSLHDILAQPRNDAEERIADAHIKREAASIRDGWSADVLAVRETGVRGTGVDRPGWQIPVVCTEAIEIL